MKCRAIKNSSQLVDPCLATYSLSEPKTVVKLQVQGLVSWVYLPASIKDDFDSQVDANQLNALKDWLSHAVGQKSLYLAKEGKLNSMSVN